MGKWPKISIITATYNSEKYIEDTIKSVVSQNYPLIEYIIIDGASTDNTMEIVNKYRDKIDLVVSEADEGIYDAFNKGISRSTGDVLLFLNSDDYLYDEDVLYKVAECFYNNPHCLCVYGSVKFINERTGTSQIKILKDLTIDDIKMGVWPQHPALFVKKTVHEAASFNNSYHIASDLDLIIDLFKNNSERCIYLNQLITVFRKGGVSSSINTLVDTWKDVNRVFYKHFGFERYYLNNSTIVLPYYKEWLESLLIKKSPVSSSLEAMGISRVAIFGSIELGLCIYEDLLMTGIKTVVFIDNCRYKNGSTVRGIPVVNPQWLASRHGDIDAVIIAIENDCYDSIRQQINDITGKNLVKIMTWKDIVASNCLDQDLCEAHTASSHSHTFKIQ